MVQVVVGIQRKSRLPRLQTSAFMEGHFPPPKKKGKKELKGMDTGNQRGPVKKKTEVSSYRMLRD